MIFKTLGMLIRAIILIIIIALALAYFSAYIYCKNNSDKCEWYWWGMKVWQESK